jgi:hypothetical protein
MIEGITFGLIGLFLMICTIFDVDWFMKMTRSSRSKYFSAGRIFDRILFGLVGLGFTFLSITYLVELYQ